MRMKPNQEQWVCSHLPCKVKALVPLSFPICPWQTWIQWALEQGTSFPWDSLDAGRMVRSCLSHCFFLAWIIIIITAAGLPEENMSLGPIPSDLVNSSPADVHIFI